MRGGVSRSVRGQRTNEVGAEAPRVEMAQLGVLWDHGLEVAGAGEIEEMQGVLEGGVSCLFAYATVVGGGFGRIAGG